MKKFTLLLNGKDLDTGVYDYFPYADKFITDFRGTKKIIKDLREGRVDRQVDEYIYGQYCIIKEDTTHLAIDSAYKAFQKFRDFSLAKRKKIFLEMHKLLLEKKEDLINILTIEGHPRKLAEWEFEGMEIGSSPQTINFYFKELNKEIGRHGNEILYISRKPDGVVCLNAPNNASASSSYNGILAFLPGNTLIVRPSSHAPISTIFLWKEVVNQALMQNGAPAGTLNVVVGNSNTIFNEWVSSRHVNNIIHFGESEKGFEIGIKIFQAGKKPILELSGNDMLAVWKDADIEKASESLLNCFFGSTQICMIPKIALIHESVYEKFLQIFIKKVKNLKISLPSDPRTVFSPVTRIQEFFEFLKDALEKGANLIYGGQRVNYLDREDKDGIFLRPTLLKINDIAAAQEMKCIKKEIFFPLLPLIKVFGSDEEVFKKISYLINNHKYGIRVSIWISSPKYLRKFVKELDNCGMLRINSRHIGFSYYLSTHGGTKKSGGPFGEMNYFWQKTSHLQGISRTVKE